MRERRFRTAAGALSTVLTGLPRSRVVLEAGPQHRRRALQRTRRGPPSAPTRPAYVSNAWREGCVERGLRHLRTRPYTPRTNAKAERCIQILPRWACVRRHRSARTCGHPDDAGLDDLLAVHGEVGRHFVLSEKAQTVTAISFKRRP